MIIVKKKLSSFFGIIYGFSYHAYIYANIKAGKLEFKIKVNRCSGIYLGFYHFKPALSDPWCIWSIRLMRLGHKYFWINYVLLF